MSHVFSNTTSASARLASRCPRSFMNHAFATSPIFEGKIRFSTLAARISRFDSPNPSDAPAGISWSSRHAVAHVSGTTIARLSTSHVTSHCSNTGTICFTWIFE